MVIEEEIQNVKNEITKLKKELNKKKNNKEEMDELEKTLHTAIENWKFHKVEEAPDFPKDAFTIQRERKRLDWKRGFTITLVVSKLIVFIAFMYVSGVMFYIEKTTEAIIIIFAVALYLILNKLEKV
jgi:hypothetical protein